MSYCAWVKCPLPLRPSVCHTDSRLKHVTAAQRSKDVQAGDHTPSITEQTFPMQQRNFDNGGFYGQFLWDVRRQLRDPEGSSFRPLPAPRPPFTGACIARRGRPNCANAATSFH